MNNLLASIGLVQLKKLNNLNKKRISILKKYLSDLKNCKSIYPAFPYKLNKSCYWLLTFRTKKRDMLMNFLKKKGISTSVHIMPLPLHPLYKKFNRKVGHSLKIWKELFSLPFFPDIKKSQIEYVIKAVREFDKKY